jgi:adenine deaminase
MNLSQRIAAARGQDPVDLLLTNLQLVNVFSGEIYPSEIA